MRTIKKPYVFAAAIMPTLSCAIVQNVQAQESVLTEVVVTGSRIVRSDYVAESPIVTLGAEALNANGPATLETTLNQMPQFAATSGASSSNQGRGGRSNANLRGLGIARTLVLLDGKRMQPSDPLGAIDLNTIATSLIESVEVITGGASAVYGSDAIAGVVNFKLKQDFEGFMLNGQYSTTERGDGDTYDLSLSLGGSFAEDRGNAVLSISYLNREPAYRGSRKFFRESGIAAVLPSGSIVADAANLPQQSVVDAVFASYGIAPGTVPASRNFGMNPDGTLFSTSAPVANLRFPEGQPYLSINNQVGNPTGKYYPLQQDTQRVTLFARTTYNFSDAIQGYAQFNYAHYDVVIPRFGITQATVRDVFVPVTNPFLPDDLRTIMASRPRPDEPLKIYFNGGRFSNANYDDTYNVGQLLGGFKGPLDVIDGSWEVYASTGRTEQTEIRHGFIDRAAYLSLVEAPDGGVSICEGGLHPLQLAPPSQECLDYLLRELHESVSYNQEVIEGSVQGRAFSLPAGDVRFAAGIGYRKNSYEFNPDSQRIAASVLGTQVTMPTQGSTQVRELFVEALVPILSGLPLVDSLNLDVAYRYSDYDSIGGVNTFKAGLDWSLTDAFRVRGGYQRAIRAPSVGELYQPSEQGSATIGRTALGQGDPCDYTSVYRTGPNAARVRELCIATGVPENVVDTLRFTGSAVSSNVSGNPDLNEETADTYTAGIVWRSTSDAPLLRNFTTSIDYYKIGIKDAIGVITGAVIMQRCFNGSGSNPDYSADNYYCRLIERNSSGALSRLTTPLLNLAGYKSSGIDLQIDWGFDLSDIGFPDGAGSLSVNAVLSYMDEYAIQSLQGAPFVNYAGTIGDAQITADAISHPRWKSTATFGYRLGDLNLDLRWRWINAMDHFQNVGAAEPTGKGVKPRHYFDLSARYRLGDGLDLRAGVINLADEQPPEWTGEGATDVAIYDILGRRYYVGMSKKF